MKYVQLRLQATNAYQAAYILKSGKQKTLLMAQAKSEQIKSRRPFVRTVESDGGVPYHEVLEEGGAKSWLLAAAGSWELIDLKELAPMAPATAENAAIHIKRLADCTGDSPYAIFEDLIQCGRITEQDAAEMAQYFEYPEGVKRTKRKRR